MKSSALSETVHVYRPLLKHRARSWFSSITMFALVGFFAVQFTGQPVGATEGLFILLNILLGAFGIVSLLAAETLKLKISPTGFVYGNLMGYITAAPGQVAEVGVVKDQIILKLDENRYQNTSSFFSIFKAPFSDGTYIPLYLFLDPWQNEKQLARLPLGKDLIRSLPHLFKRLPQDLETSGPEKVEPLQPQTGDTALEESILLAGGRYRLRSRSSLTIIIGLMLLSPLAMAAAGLFGGSQVVLLPGLLAGWLVPLLLGGIEVRPTPLTDLIGLAAMLLLGGLSTLFLLAGCAWSPAAPGCSANEYRSNLFAFFFFPMIMYLLPWLIFTRLPLLFRRK